MMIPAPDRADKPAPPSPPTVATPKPKAFHHAAAHAAVPQPANPQAAPRREPAEAGSPPVTAGPAASTPTPSATASHHSPLDRFVGAAKAAGGAVVNAGTGAAKAIGNAVADAGAGMASEFDTVTRQIKDVTNPAPSINKLKGTGDTATFSGTALGSVRVANPYTKVPVGPQASYGYDATVTQTQPKPGGPPGYDVQFGKNEAGGLGTVFGVGGEKSDKVVVSGELNIATADRVTVSFSSKADAARAVRISSQAALAQSLRDVGGALQGNIPNPRNPLTGTGAPHHDDTLGGLTGVLPLSMSALGDVARPVLNAVADSLQPSAADTKFMRDHITSYSTVLSGTARGMAEFAFAKLSFGGKAPATPSPDAPAPGGSNPKLKGELAVQPRLLEQAQITRTVDLPPGGGPGTLSYSVGGNVTADAKERATAISRFAGAAQILPVANVADLGKASITGKVSYKLTQAETQDMRRSGGNSLPEVAMARDGRLGNPASASVTLDLTVPVQNQTLPYQTDQSRFSGTATLQNPRGFAGDLVNNVLNGRFDDSIKQAQRQGRIQVTEQTLDRSGHTVAIDPSIGVLNKFSVGAGALVTVRNDHVASTLSYDSHPDLPPGHTAPEPPQLPRPLKPSPQQPVPPKPRQFVVLPRDGVNVRAQPSAGGDKVAIVQSGSFLEADGRTATDAAGRRWASVSGTDVNDRPTRGWVDAEFLRRHDEGAMDATGRTDPGLDGKGYGKVVASPGDTVWGLATANGKDPKETVALNRGHIIDPNLVFAGDTVYLPK